MPIALVSQERFGRGIQGSDQHMSKFHSIVGIALLASAASPVWSADSESSAARTSFDAGVRFAGDGGNEVSLGAAFTSAKGWSFDAYGSRTTDAESNQVEFDPRYWSLGFGKEFKDAGWRATVRFAAFDDAVQVETQDVSAALGWSNESGGLTLDASVGDVDETVEVPLPRGGTRIATLTTDRTGFGVGGFVNAGEHISLSAGFRTYDYDATDERLASRPRLQQYLIANVFTAQQGLVDSSWNVGVAAYIGSMTASVDFAQSEESNGNGTADDVRFALEIPFASSWQVILGAGYFSSSGAASDEGSAYGSIGLRFTNP
jgi:hypothetical protein